MNGIVNSLVHSRLDPAIGLAEGNHLSNFPSGNRSEMRLCLVLGAHLRVVVTNAESLKFALLV